MKMMKGIVAAAITAATFLCFGGVQVTKQYCDSNRDKAVQNAIESVQTALPSLVGPAVDDYMADKGIPTVQTNTVVIEKFQTNNVSTVTNHYVVTRETNIVQNVQTNITVNRSEEYRTVIDASDRIVSTNGSVTTTIYAQNKRIEKVKHSVVTESVATNLYKNLMSKTLYLRDYDQLTEVKGLPGYANYYHYKIVDQPTVDVIEDRNHVWRFEGVFVPMTSMQNWNFIKEGFSGVSFSLGFKIQGGYLSIDQDGTTNYVTATTFPAIGSTLRNYSKSAYWYSDGRVMSWNSLSTSDIWIVSNDPDYYDHFFYGLTYYGSTQTSVIQFQNVNEISSTTVLNEKSVDDLVGYSEIPNVVAGISANNIITNNRFKTQVNSALDVMFDENAAPVITRATTAAQRAEAVVMNYESTVSNMSNYWDSTKWYYDSKVSQIAGYRADAVQAAQNANSYRSSAEAASAAAQTAYGNTVNAANNGISQINERIAWFDQYSGKEVTVNNFTTNIYYAEDSVARSGVSANSVRITANEGAISSLESRVGDNITTLQGQLSSATSRITANERAISSLESRVGDNITTIQNDIDSIDDRVHSIESYINPDQISCKTQAIYKCDSVPEWSFKIDSSNYSTVQGIKMFEILEQTRPTSIGRDSISGFKWNPSGYNYGIQIDYYISGRSGYKTIYEWFVFPDVFTVKDYTFRKYSERYIPIGSYTNTLVKAVSLFGDNYNPKKTDSQMLDDVIDSKTSNLSSRIEAIESSGKSKTLQCYISSDFNVYDPNGVKIGRIMRDTDWNALSNWVESVFQKK